MKSTIRDCFFVWTLFVLCSFTISSSVSKKHSVEYPIYGKIKFVNSPMIEYNQIYFYVHDKSGNEIYFSNHSIGASAGNASPSVALLADAEYLKMMTNQGHKLRNRNLKTIQN